MSQSLLAQAINAESVTTTNGMPTFQSSLDYGVDLFFQIGASRGKDIIPAFSLAYNEDPEIATRIALWVRDVRGGAGERQLFKDILLYMVTKELSEAKRMMRSISELGRWDDILVLFGTPLEKDALRMITHALKEEKCGLCAKWMPRPNAGNNKKWIAFKIRKYMGLSAFAYRKLLKTLSSTVEQQMCASEWSNINYSHVPSLAAARYQQTFTKHDPEGYGTYRSDLKRGKDKDGNTVKINAGAIYPYDVIKSLKSGLEDVANEQWNALPNYLEGSKENILPIVDTSGSMMCGVGGRGLTTCLDIAVSLGLYLSERTEGIFKDTFMTFSQSPKMQTVNGSLSDRYKQMRTADWGMSTNLEAVFNLLLVAAVQHNVPPEEMPTQLLILSDMQFNHAVRNVNDKVMEMIKRQYEGAGYKTPVLVYWNINAHNGSPVTAGECGTALISGFSPAIMTSVLSADMEDFTPKNMMLKTIMDERYNY